MEDQDLREIGITDPSHRKKLLHAARSLPKVRNHDQLLLQNLKQHGRHRSKHHWVISALAGEGSGLRWQQLAGVLAGESGTQWVLAEVPG